VAGTPSSRSRAALPWRRKGQWLLRAYVYDEEVVVLGAVTRVEYTAPAATKCDKQEGKCKKRDCQKWHWQPMDAGKRSVREPMLETQRDVKQERDGDLNLLKGESGLGSGGQGCGGSQHPANMRTKHISER
jgi:hypothetical protein